MPYAKSLKSRRGVRLRRRKTIRTRTGTRLRTRYSKGTKKTTFASRSKALALYRPRVVNNNAPRSQRFKLTYRTSMEVPFGYTIGTVATYYRQNSLYDPEVAVGGGQPVGFDQLALTYNAFYVWGCKAVVRIGAADRATAAVCEPFQVAIVPFSVQTKATSIPTKAEDAVLRVGAVQKNISNLNALTKPARLVKFMRVQNYGYHDNNFYNQYNIGNRFHGRSSNPSTCPEFGVFIDTVPFSSGTGASTCLMDVEITYYGYAISRDWKED